MRGESGPVSHRAERKGLRVGLGAALPDGKVRGWAQGFWPGPWGPAPSGSRALCVPQDCLEASGPRAASRAGGWDEVREVGG